MTRHHHGSTDARRLRVSRLLLATVALLLTVRGCHDCSPDPQLSPGILQANPLIDAI
jgi:hypothetical protein